MIALEPGTEAGTQDLDCCALVDRAYCDRIQRHIFGRAHGPASVSHTSLPFGPEFGPLRGVAPLHPKMRPFCGLLYFEFFFVSCLAGHAAFALDSAMGAALGRDCFLYVCPGGEFGRMASDFHSFANGRNQRCHVGQLCGVDSASSDISLSELETARNGCRRRLGSGASLTQ
jgi:hypothetical protein